MPEPDEIRHEEDRIIIYATYVVKVDMGIEFDRTNPIGEGTYATVYAGTASLGTIEMGGKFSVVAVKVFKPAVLADSKRYKYVLNEIQNGEKRAQIAALQSPHLLPIIAVHEDSSKPELHIIMPHRNGSLEDLLQTDPYWIGTYLDPKQDGLNGEGLLKCDPVESGVKPHRLNIAGILLPQMLSALESLHTLNIAHRDLKPSNILWSHETTNMHKLRIIIFVLSDFGPTRDLTVHDAMSSRGSRAFLAPEVYKEIPRDDRNPTVAVDIWALFATMVYTLGFYDPSSIDFERSDIKPYNHVLSIRKELEDSSWEQLFTNMGNEDPSARKTADLIRKGMYPAYLPPEKGIHRWD